MCTAQVLARSIFFRIARVIVWCRWIGASEYFKLVARAITIGINQAIALAIVAYCRERARAIVIRSQTVVVACRVIGATCNFKFVASTVAVCIV